jgi:hypothetical protein
VDANPLHHAFVLRVHRASAGTEVPFDKIYIFNKRDKELLPRVFRNAMVFPITAAFADQMGKVFRAGGSKLGRMYAHNRFGEAGLQKWAERKLPFENLRDERDNYLALVPVLFTRQGSKRRGNRHTAKRKNVSFASYIVAKPGGNTRLMRDVVSARAYFIVDGAPIKPICLICPKHQSTLQGKCMLGEAECLEHLSRTKAGDMVRGLKQYEEWQAQISEPAIDVEAT